VQNLELIVLGLVPAADLLDLRDGLVLLQELRVPGLHLLLQAIPLGAEPGPGVPQALQLSLGQGAAGVGPAHTHTHTHTHTNNAGWVRVCMRVCACVRACMRVCVCMCACVPGQLSLQLARFLSQVCDAFLLSFSLIGHFLFLLNIAVPLLAHQLLWKQIITRLPTSRVLRPPEPPRRHGYLSAGPPSLEVFLQQTLVRLQGAEPLGMLGDGELEGSDVSLQLTHLGREELP